MEEVDEEVDEEEEVDLDEEETTVGGDEEGAM